MSNNFVILSSSLCLVILISLTSLVVSSKSQEVDVTFYENANRQGKDPPNKELIKKVNKVIVNIDKTRSKYNSESQRRAEMATIGAIPNGLMTKFASRVVGSSLVDRYAR